MIIIWTNLVELESSMLYTKIQTKSFLDSGEDFPVVFFQYIDMAAIFFNCTEPFDQMGNTLSTEGPCKIWWKLLNQFQRRRHLKQEAHGPQVAHLSDIATADMQMLCNIFPILSSQLMKRSSFKQFLILKKNIYGMTVNGAWSFEQTLNHISKVGSMWNLMANG